MEMDTAVTAKTVADHCNSEPHFVCHEVGVRVRTLGLLCDADVLKRPRVPIVSNLCQIADVAIVVLALFPTFFEMDEHRADCDVKDNTNPNNCTVKHIALFDIHLQLFKKITIIYQNYLHK